MSEEKLNMQDKIMSQIRSGQIKMKPRWYFILGSVLSIIGFAGLTVASIFLTGLISFSLRSHGPMGSYRFEQLVSNFPWWAVALAIIGIGAGVWMLKKQDFSYKNNFLFIVLGFVLAIILAGWLMDVVGVNERLQRRGPVPMRRFYQQQKPQESFRVPFWTRGPRGC